MPLITQGNLVPVRVEFDQETYGANDTIRFQVVIDGDLPEVNTEEVFTGTVTLPGQQPERVSGVARVAAAVAYGPFTSDRYEVVQDPDNPSRFTATPEDGETP
ncbi:hypothetical protein AB0J14_04760 [Micromonospora arborensis]|uniref:hypothetical protein n=1 Tax=Micromonospora arborensis TaxID=2116518 RepID=UPI00340D25D2